MKYSFVSFRSNFFSDALINGKFARGANCCCCCLPKKAEKRSYRINAHKIKMNFETNENHRQFLFTLIWFLSVWSSDESNEEKKSVKLPCALLCCGFGCKSTVTQHQPNRRFFYYFGNCMIPYLQIVLSTFILLTVARCVYSIFRFSFFLLFSIYQILFCFFFRCRYSSYFVSYS